MCVLCVLELGYSPWKQVWENESELILCTEDDDQYFLLLHSLN